MLGLVEGEKYITSCCWFSWIDLAVARISASSGAGPTWRLQRI